MKPNRHQTRRRAPPLFRRAPLRARGEPLHGQVTLAVPPGSRAAALASLACLLLLTFAAWIIEVPQRVRAVGVLMPSDGLLRVVAAQPGRVTRIRVRENQRVAAGQAIVELSSSGVSADSAARLRLESLRLERLLQRDAARREQALLERRGDGLDDRIGRLDDEWRAASADLRLQEDRARLLERRVDRLAALAMEGNAARDAGDEARVAWLQARSQVEGLRRETMRLAGERQRLDTERASLDDEAELARLERAQAFERTRRETAGAEAQVARTLRAPRGGVVARVAVRAGEAVRGGQTVAVLYRGAGRLEAWLYLPATDALTVREGQPVELRFAAEPQRLSRPAVVSSVSAIALTPSELDVPLPLTGPVFEIRATLAGRTFRDRGREWSLAAGTVVRADLVKRRYRLFEWLLRRWRSERAFAPADA